MTSWGVRTKILRALAASAAAPAPAAAEASPLAVRSTSSEVRASKHAAGVKSYLERKVVPALSPAKVHGAAPVPRRAFGEQTNMLRQ